jgi:hypothetical protein
MQDESLIRHLGHENSMIKIDQSKVRNVKIRLFTKYLWDCNLAQECWNSILPAKPRGIYFYDEA